MNTDFRSEKITLLLAGDDLGRDSTVDGLWQTFRRTAVEPGQAPSPDVTSFADSCLLCAQIMVNEPVPAEDEQENNTAALDPLHSPSPGPVEPSPFRENRTAGLVYLHVSPANHAGGEANIGVITTPDLQHRGYAREAVHVVLRWAFEELKFHRIQAAVPDTPSKDRALRLFIGCGFAHEGTKRRAVYQSEGEGMAGVWRDVTYLAMLDTEWMLKSTWMRANRTPKPPIVSVWDEMFARHAREREELVRWEEKHGRIRRTSSMETVRDRAKKAAQEIAYLTDDVSSLCSSSPPSPGPNVIVTLEEDALMADDPVPDEPHHRWEEVVETLAARRHRQWVGSSFLGPSLQGHPLLSLQSIPSTGVSEGNLQSPLTIPSPSNPASTPPSSASPSPAPSSVHSTWSSTEDEDEDEDDLILRDDSPPTHAPVPIQFTMAHDPYSLPRLASVRTRSRSSSVSSHSSDSWSDAQSSMDTNSSSWDVVSDASDRGRSISL